MMSSVIFQAGVDYELVAYCSLTHIELPFELTSSEHDQCALKSVIRLAWCNSVPILQGGHECFRIARPKSDQLRRATNVSYNWFQCTID